MAFTIISNGTDQNTLDFFNTMDSILSQDTPNPPICSCLPLLTHPQVLINHINHINLNYGPNDIPILELDHLGSITLYKNNKAITTFILDIDLYFPTYLDLMFLTNRPIQFVFCPEVLGFQSCIRGYSITN